MKFGHNEYIMWGTNHTLKPTRMLSAHIRFFHVENEWIWRLVTHSTSQTIGRKVCCSSNVIHEMMKSHQDCPMAKKTVTYSHSSHNGHDHQCHESTKMKLSVCVCACWTSNSSSYCVNDLSTIGLIRIENEHKIVDVINVLLIVFLCDAVSIEASEHWRWSRCIVLSPPSLMNLCKSDIFVGISAFTCATYGFLYFNLSWIWCVFGTWC